MTKKKKSAKMVALVQAAKELFFRHGIKRISIEEICSKSGVSRVTFYRYFPDKTAIAKYVLEGVFAEGRKKRDDILAMDVSFEEKMQKILLMKLEYSETYGKEFMSEFMANADPELRRYLEEESAKALDELKCILLDARERGDIRSDVKIEFVMYMLNAMKAVFCDESLRKLYPDTGALIKETFNFFYYGILERQTSDRITG